MTETPAPRPERCWSCRTRPAAPRSAPVRLRRTTDYRVVYVRYLHVDVRVPLCRICSPVWRAHRAVEALAGCCGCLLVVVVLVAAIAAGWRILLGPFPIVAGAGLVVAIGLKVYELVARPSGEKLRDPRQHPAVAAARKRHGVR